MPKQIIITYQDKEYIDLSYDNECNYLLFNNNKTKNIILPPNVLFADLSSNQLEYIEISGNQLVYLDISNNNFNLLPENLPSTLNHLEVNNNPLLVIPNNLPNNLVYFNYQIYSPKNNFLNLNLNKEK